MRGRMGRKGDVGPAIPISMRRTTRLNRYDILRMAFGIYLLWLHFLRSSSDEIVLPF